MLVFDLQVLNSHELLLVWDDIRRREQLRGSVCTSVLHVTHIFYFILFWIFLVFGNRDPNLV